MYSRQMTLKREMRSRLRSSPDQFEQTVFEFELVNGEPKASSFEWEEEGGEFRYNGSMYDVIEKKITGNIVRFRCIDDKEEAGILKKMEDLQKKGQDNNKSGPFSLQQLLALLLYNQHNCCETTTFFSPLHHVDDYCESFTPVIIDILVPPPRR